MLLALLLSFLALQDPAPLPTPPAGWRTEHLTFPLSFAPELEYRGTEDLAFAPGMFTLDSDSYFSYALALVLEGDVLIDAEMLTRFLETYYRGLCRAVAADRKLELDWNKVRAVVTRHGAAYRATIQMFDPFTNGQELELVLELHVHARPHATEILGLASPLDDEAPVWGQLHALRDPWLAARPAPVFLNHLFVVVDPETYAALAASTFLREIFAVSEERTTVRADRTYTGLYFYGERTYFEFLKPGSYVGTGLALGVERARGLEDFARRLEGEHVRTQAGPITRQLDGADLPWFQILGLEMPTSALTVFAMEYDPDFLVHWRGMEFAHGWIARRDVLDGYAARLERTELRQRSSFLDISSVELSLNAVERQALAKAARAALWELEEEETRLRASGPQISLSVSPAAKDPSAGITRFEVRLRTPIAREPLTLGRITVTFEDSHAVFRLAP
jgi:hypothetical protein